MNKNPTQEYVKSILDYDPETGLFTWKARVAACIHIGDPAGHKRSDGYIVIKIKHKAMKAHRLAWLYIYGEYPKHDTDHINGIKDDNRIANLRDISHRQNGCNRQKNRNGGLPGVGLCRNSQTRWYARAQINGYNKHLGLFCTREEAYAAYCKACAEIAG